MPTNRKTLAVRKAMPLAGFLAAAFASQPAHAGTFAPVGNPVLDQFLSETATLLPTKVRDAIRNPIVVTFKKLDRHPTVLPPTCSGQKVSPDLEQAVRNYGNPKLGGFNTFTQAIYLNQNFIPEITAGPKSSTTYPCGHKNLYRLAQASILHEVAHYYDSLNLPATEDPKEREKRAWCENQKAIHDGELPRSCSDLASLTDTLSSRPAFRALTGSGRGTFGTSRKNKLTKRSPDPYELDNAKEALAVNFEYFVLDPEYSCRRPALAEFFQQHFETPTKPCPVQTKVRYNQEKTLVDLDPERIYQIHYLLADRGEEAMSRFGHAMFRIIQCAPSRKAVGQDCLKDVGHHVVASFRANITDTNINYFSGIFGGYPSQLFFMRFSNVLSEYTLGESRDVISLPIAMDRTQIRRFVHLALEQYWSYRGEYYFLSNNCAGESLDVIQAIYPELPLKGYDEKVILPRTIYERLLEQGLIDERLLNERQAVGQYFFPGLFRQVAPIFEKITAALGNPKGLTLEQFVDELGPEQRAALYEQAVQRGAVSRQQLAGYFIQLEMQARLHLETRLQEKLAKIADGNIPKDFQDRSTAIAALVKAALAAIEPMQPWNVASRGYGIPTLEEVSRTDDFERNWQEYAELRNKIDAEGRTVMAANIAAIVTSTKNIQKLLTDARQNRADNGMTP